MKRPKADTVEMINVVPGAFLLVSGMGFLWYAMFEGDMVLMRITGVVFVLSVVVLFALGVWHELLERAEHAATYRQQMARIRFRPGRATVQLLERD